jgi:hypothetical protein
MLGYAKKAVSFVPAKIRPVVLVLAVILVVFLVSKYTSKYTSAATPKKNKKNRMGLQLEQLQENEPPESEQPSSPSPLVRNAMSSIDRASSAETVVDQLRYLTFGISQLEAAKTLVDQDVDRLSSVSGVDVAKLEEYLRHAEGMCVAALKRSKGKGKVKA